MALIKQVRPALNKSEGEAAQVSPKVLEDVCLLDMKLHQAQGELEGRGRAALFLNATHWTRFKKMAG